MLITAHGMLHADGSLAPGWVRVDAGLVTEVGRGAPEPPGTPVDLAAAVLIPGFVDVHCHGGGGGSFPSGDPDQAEQAIRAHRAHGTTTVLASLVSDGTAELERQVGTLAGLVHSGELGGIHLEGPWLSQRRCGAHDPAVLSEPTAEAVDRLLAAADGALRMVTLAPELPGATGAIRRLRAAGVVVALGHTDADAETTSAAIDAGATVATHLFNAMPPLGHREPGPVPVLLGDERVVVEVVADGIHLHPQILRLVSRAARGGWALVSDAMAAAAAPDGDYRLGRVEVEVRDGVARLAGADRIAGSTLTLSRAVRTAVAAGIPLADALVAATVTPARALGLDAGVLEPGRRADLVALDAELEVAAVLWRGEWAVSPPAGP